MRCRLPSCCRAPAVASARMKTAFDTNAALPDAATGICDMKGRGTSNQTMQRTASRAAIYLLCACHPPLLMARALSGFPQRALEKAFQTARASSLCFF